MIQKKDNMKTYLNEKTIITVKEDWCKACGICIYYCPKKVLVANEKGHPVAKNIDDCIQCMLCELRCPDFAIQVKKREKVGIHNIKDGRLKEDNYEG